MSVADGLEGLGWEQADDMSDGAARRDARTDAGGDDDDWELAPEFSSHEEDAERVGAVFVP